MADDDTAETLSQRILGIEHRIYPEALRLLASGKVRLEGDICKIVRQDRSRRHPDFARGDLTSSVASQAAGSLVRPVSLGCGSRTNNDAYSAVQSGGRTD